MSIDWQHFTPWTSLAGGALIGLAVALFHVLTRQVAGISGIFHALLRPGTTDFARNAFWRLAFIAGLLLAPWIFHPPQFAGPMERPGDDLLLTLVAGAFTGYGTWTARGCTSGHGICGLSRLSPRSLVAVLCFMFMGMMTVTAVRYLHGATP
jgi:uncharacterized membrane protein YedE/YeeE